MSKFMFENDSIPPAIDQTEQWPNKYFNFNQRCIRTYETYDNNN